MYIIRITIAASKITAAATLSPLTEVSESELRTLAKIKVRFIRFNFESFSILIVSKKSLNLTLFPMV